MFVFPRSAGELRASSDILSDVEDSEDVFSCFRMGKESGDLLSPLVVMMKNIYLLAIC